MDLPISSYMPLLDTLNVTNSAQNEQAEKTSTGLPSEFRDLMAVMMLSSMSMSGSSSSESSGMGIQQLMAPLMLTLLEKLLAGQVETEEAPVVKEIKKTTVSTPQGMPIKGQLTQGSHAGHIALDFGAPVGTPVKATMDGKVTYAGWNNEGYGNLVIVENGPYKTYYAHLSKLPVSIGDKVSAGKVIGLSGNTGNSTGPHLHYEVRKNNQQIDPTNFTLKK